MRLKSFFANTIEEAIRQARMELGADAMLVNSKQTGAEARHLGAYEVVVCGDPRESATVGEPREARRSLSTRPILSSGVRGASPVQSNPAQSNLDQVARDVSELKLHLKQQMDKLAMTFARAGTGTAGGGSDGAISRIVTALADAEVDVDLALDIVSRIQPPSLPQKLRSELGKLASVSAELGSLGATPKVTALIGPPGCGKTSALVKLAVQYGVGARKLVHVLTIDTYRISAAEELRSYAAILGIGFQVLETPAALGPALDECRHKDLVLIDTPGLSGTDLEAFQDWGNILSSRPGIDIHLVLPASMRAADMKRVAGQYSMFHPHKLLFTRLDETQTLGPLLSLSVRMARPISFFSSGQRIPEDLVPATADMMLASILAEVEEQAISESQAPLKYETVAA
jgi:flagellar biosynthesis protein FlhF